MPQSYEELEARARELTNADRVRLAQALISSFSLRRSPEELQREVKKIAEGRFEFTMSDRARLVEQMERPLRARERRIDDVERRLSRMGARLEELEAHVIDRNAD